MPDERRAGPPQAISYRSSQSEAAPERLARQRRVADNGRNPIFPPCLTT